MPILIYDISNYLVQQLSFYFLKIKNQKIQEYRRKPYAFMYPTRSVLHSIQDSTPASISILQHPLFPAVWSVVSSTQNLRKWFSSGLLAESFHRLVETAALPVCFVHLSGKGAQQNINLCNSFHEIPHKQLSPFNYINNSYKKQNSQSVCMFKHKCPFLAVSEI